MLNTINVYKYIHPLTMEAAVQVAFNLRPDDYREVYEGHGYFPPFHIPQVALNGDSYYFEAPNGKIAAIGGIMKDGRLWMLCTNTIKEFPRQFVKDSLRMLNSRPENLLWNVVDKRNETHIKLLRFLGFKFLREISYGPNNITFIEFCKLCVEQPQLEQSQE